MQVVEDSRVLKGCEKGEECPEYQGKDIQCQLEECLFHVCNDCNLILFIDYDY